MLDVTTQMAEWENDGLIDRILEYAVVNTFKAGEIIISPVDDARSFYFVQSGTVEVSYTDRSDTRITVALIGSGEFFGEIGFFDGESRVRDIRAGGDVQVAVFDTTVMKTIWQADQTLFTNFLLLITRKICSKFRRIAGEREPIAGYAQSLATRRVGRYAESRPIPPSLLHSSSWHRISSRMEQFKSELFDLSHQLQSNEATGQRDPAVEERCSSVLAALNGSLSEFREAMDGSGYEEVMWGYVFKEIFPYFMRSHFAERAYYKPKGYAGDFLMMEHIYADEPKGDGRLGEIIDHFCLQRPGSLAIRGRRRLLSAELSRLSGNLVDGNRAIRIMNLACGPNRELFDFLAACEYSEQIEALCVDIDAEALQYTNQHVNVFPHRASIRLMSENVIKWSLGRVNHRIEDQDIIYSAGLCDYLDTRLFRALITRCYHQLRPGGTLLLGNFTFYPDSLFLDKLLKWELIYRTEEELRELFEPTPFGTDIEIIAEQEQVNLFARATRS